MSAITPVLVRVVVLFILNAETVLRCVLLLFFVVVLYLGVIVIGTVPL